jgi:hypothetical protein
MNEWRSQTAQYGSRHRFLWRAPGDLFAVDHERPRVGKHRRLINGAIR